jgi:POT family proton-dependent oligopeptide transporter
MTNPIEKQPRALYLLFFVQMWECFSYYGMRVLLILYMIEVLGFSDTKSFGVFAIYCALVECGGIFGGRLADKYLGQRFSIFTGGSLICLGHLLMMLGRGEGALYISLASIATGTGLFSSNISSLLSMFYGENDPRRDQGFTLFYIGINLGAILATGLVGTIGELFGWHAGFGTAALGMLLATLSLFLFRKVLKGKGELPSPLTWQTNTVFFLGVFSVIAILTLAIDLEQWMMHLIPLICLGAVVYAGRLIYTSKLMPMRTLASLGGCLVVLALFFAAEELTGGALLLFTERVANNSLFGIEIPSVVVVGINPFVIITLGMWMSKLTAYLKLSTSARLALGCLFGAGAFGSLSLLATIDGVGILSIIGCILMLSFGELLIGPVVYAYFAEVAPQKLQGVIMGLIPIGYSLGSIIAGFFNQTMALEDVGVSTEVYANGFANMSILLLSVAVAVYATNAILKGKEKVLYES